MLLNFVNEIRGSYDALNWAFAGLGSCFVFFGRMVMGVVGVSGVGSHFHTYEEPLASKSQNL